MGFSAMSQEYKGITVSNYPQKLNPGEHFTIYFEIAEKENETFEDELSIPEGWKILVKQSSKNNGIKKFLYTVFSPQNGQAGTHKIEFRLKRYDIVFDLKAINVELSEIRKIAVSLASQPEEGKEGEEVIVNYLVQNLGNKDEKVLLVSKSGVVLDYTDSVTIAANDFLKVRVQHTIPKQSNYSASINSDLRVHNGTSEPHKMQMTSIPVYSSKVEKSDPYLRFPLEVGVGYLNFKIGDQSYSAMQYYLEGRGYLDFSKKHWADLNIKGPNQFSFPSVSSYDQYTFIYKYENKLEVTLGDFNNRFTNLMEFGRFGRGIEALYRIENRHTISGFYNKARFSTEQKDSYGGSYFFNIKGNTGIGVNFISRNLSSNGSMYASNIAGLNGKIYTKHVSMQSEAAIGRAKGKTDVALFNRMNVNLWKIAYNNEVIYAGKNFHGFYNNSILLNNGLSLAINKRLNAGVNSNISRINPSLDAIDFSVSPYTTSLMPFLSFNYNNRHSVLISYNTRESEDRQKVSAFHYKEEFTNISYSLTKTRLNWNSQFRYGNSDNLLSDDFVNKKQSLSMLTQPTAAIFPWLWLGAYVEYQNTGKFSKSDQLESLFFYGGNVNAAMGKIAKFNFSYRNNYAPDEFFERRSFLDANLNFDFKRHSMSLRASKVFEPFLNNVNNSTLFVSLNYKLKLNVPIQKNWNQATAKGRIMGLSEGISTAGILVELGQYKVLTDADGNFEFPNLEPANYQISLIDSKNSIDVISTLKSPITIEVAPELNNYIEIPLIRAGELSGVVAFENMKLKDGTAVESPEVYIKLWNENEKYVTAINKESTFSFKEVNPGMWFLHAFIPGNDDKFEIINNDQEISIKSGEKKVSQFTIQYLERKIKFETKTLILTVKN